MIIKILKMRIRCVVANVYARHLSSSL